MLDWLARAPAVLGQFVQLSFYCDGELVGISISRLEELPACGRVAKIVHLHAARLDMIDWMLGVTVHHLVEHGAGAVLCARVLPGDRERLVRPRVLAAEIESGLLVACRKRCRRQDCSI